MPNEVSIRLTCSQTVGQVDHRFGSVLSLPDDQALQLVVSGAAKYIGRRHMTGLAPPPISYGLTARLLRRTKESSP